MIKEQITQQIQDAILDMASRIERDSEHIYRNKETGEMLQGVSTVSSIVPKDWLSAWGAKEAVKALGYSDYENDVENALIKWKDIKDCEKVEDYIKILKEAKGAHARKSKKAMVDGTKGHSWLQSFVEARINGDTLPQLPGDALERPLMQFLEWETSVDYWVASEALICNLEKSYGGQLDAICVLKTGELCLIDFKFSSHISEDYYLQTGGYAACFEKYGILFDKRIIIRLPKTLEKEEWDTHEFKYKKVPNNIDIFTVKTQYIGDREAFYAALIVKKWINYVTK